MKNITKIFIIVLIVLAFPIRVLAITSPLNQGGTGWSTSTPGDTFTGTTSPLQYTRIPIGPSGYLYQSNGTQPNWVAPSTITNNASGTPGNIQFAGPGQTFNANGLFTWDNSSKFLAIGTTTPWATLTVQGVATGTTSTYLVDFASSSGASYLMVTNQGRVGIGTITPTSTLFVQGTGGTNPFAIASSTGTQLLTVTQAGNVGIGTVSPAQALDVNGNILVEGTNRIFFASGGSSLYQDVSGNTILNAGTTSIAFNNHANTVTNMIIKDNGTVGIGTTTPSTRLSIVGTLAIDPFDISSTSGVSLLRFTQGGNLGIGTTTPAKNLVIIKNDNGTDPIAQFYANNLTQGVGIGFNIISQLSSSAALNLTSGSSGITLNDTNSFPTIINRSGGNVGIGTSSPTATLFVQGNGIINPFVVASSSGSTQLVTVVASGNVGIGISAPSGKLDIGSTAAAEIKLNTTASAGTIQGLFAADLRGSIAFGANNGSDIQFAPKSGGNTIVANGNVGIGTTSPSGTLHIYATSNPRIILDRTTTGSGALALFDTANVVDWGYGVPSTGSDFVYQAAGTTNVMTLVKASAVANTLVLSAGNVGIGTTTPAYKLVVNGTVQLPALTTSAGLQTAVLCLNAANEVISDSVACLASARKYKTSIKPLSVGLDETLKLQPVEFKWTKAYNKGFENDPNKNGVQYSLVADDVQKIDPKLTTVDSTGSIHGLADLNHWVALFVQSFKDIQAEIIKLTFRLNTHDAQIQSLQSQNDKQDRQIKILQQEIINLELRK